MEAYPLQWPPHWPRTQHPMSSNFRPGSPYGEAVDITRQLKLMGATNVVVNSNMMYKNDGTPYARQGNIEDPGIAVYFTLNGEQQCIPCDKWRSIGENLRAVSKTIEALRGLDRWGAKEMVNAAFRGFRALPAETIMTPHTSRAWWEVLDVSQNASESVIRAAYKAKLHESHPDKGGTQQAFEELQKAYKESQQ